MKLELLYAEKAMISRRSVLAALAVFATAPSRSSRAAGSHPTFLAFGDWGTRRSANNQQKVAVQMAKSAESIDARFFITTGDNFYPHGVQSVQDARWVTSFEEIYQASAFMRPWYVTLGDHDHKGNVSAQVSYTGSRWRLPANYYKHIELLADGSKADFFHIDTTPMIKKHTLRDEQLVWLERELAASSATWKLVVGHHPIYSGGNYGSTSALVATLKPLLERFGVQAYLNGHNHNLEHVVIGNLHYLTTGASSKPRPATAIEGTRFVQGERLGFMTARLTPTAMNIEFIDHEGVSLYEASVPSR